MPNHRMDITGQRFGHLTALRPDRKTISGNWRWWCRCDCGTEKSIASGELRKGSTISCGCHRIAASAAASTRHGHAGKNRTPEYQAWSAMKHRCYRPANRAYKNYGGRGIQVCERWRDSFDVFLSDVGPRPSSHHSLDRIDNAGHYEPANVRWANWVAQQRNRRSNHRLTFRNERLTIAEWAARTGMHKGTIRSRLNHDWTVEAALTTPVDVRHSTHHSRLKKAQKS